MKRIITFFLIMCVIMSLGLTASAAPFGSYNYAQNNDGTIVSTSAPNAYTPKKVLFANDLGIELNTPEDLFVDDKGNFYIVDSKLDKLYSFDKDWNLRYTLDANKEQSKAGLYIPRGICVLEGLLYVADTGNKRIAIFNAENGEFVREITEIKGDVLTDEFVFKPNKLAVSPNGSIYIVAEAALEGIIEISSEGEFYGYIGSNKTTVSAFELLWRRIFTDAQLSQLSKIVPLEYHNVSLDESSFIYTVTAASDADSRVKRLNPSGDNVLIEGELKVQGDHIYEISPSNFVDIAAGKNGQYFILDSNEGRVFSYDEEGNLLYLFGDSNTNQVGAFADPSALCVNGEEILVLDRGMKSITIYESTEYAALLAKALELYKDGEYEEDYKLWQQVLKTNGNFSLAYEKAGFCQYRMHNYKEAMELFKAAGASEQYSKAFVKYRQEQASANFPIIVLILVLVVGAIAAFIVYRAKKRAKIHILDAFYTPDSDEPFLKKNFKLAYSTMWHPTDNFWNIRFEKRGSAIAAAMFMFIYFLVTLFDRQMRAFLFNSAYGTPMNIGFQFAVVAVPIALLVIANWSITTLLDGKGNMRDIFCVLGYSLLPLIIITPILAVATQFLSLDEAAYVTLIQGIAFLWTFALVVMGIKEVHQYSWAKTIATLLLTIVAVAVILFICLLFFSLLQEIIGFVHSVFKEISMR